MLLSDYAYMSGWGGGGRGYKQKLVMLGTRRVTNECLPSRTSVVIQHLIDFSLHSK